MRYNKEAMQNDKTLERSLTYAAFVLLMFEQVKSLIVEPIRAFYANTTFVGGPFTDYKNDVLKRDKNEFEACLQYLRDFMEAIDLSDYTVIQSLRKHRNDLAHNLPERIEQLEMGRNVMLLRSARDVLFKLCNYQVKIDIGADPDAQAVIQDWDSVYGREYAIIEKIIDQVDSLADFR